MVGSGVNDLFRKNVVTRLKLRLSNTLWHESAPDRRSRGLTWRPVRREQREIWTVLFLLGWLRLQCHLDAVAAIGRDISSPTTARFFEPELHAGPRTASAHRFFPGPDRVSSLSTRFGSSFVDFLRYRRVNRPPSMDLRRPFPLRVAISTPYARKAVETNKDVHAP